MNIKQAYENLLADTTHNMKTGGSRVVQLMQELQEVGIEVHISYTAIEGQIPAMGHKQADIQLWPRRHLYQQMDALRLQVERYEVLLAKPDLTPEERFELDHLEGKHNGQPEQ